MAKKTYKTYSEKLKDPRWQKMRLQVLEREKFTCEDCKSKEKTLHVHHTFYTKGANPWEYDAQYLRCLCDDCHTKRADVEAVIYRTLGRLKGDNLTGFWNHCVRYMDFAFSSATDKTKKWLDGEML
jgi:5-methylcytosine-specific restriction endonuclease McrA